MLINLSLNKMEHFSRMNLMIVQTFLIIISISKQSLASRGDQSYVFGKCVGRCFDEGKCSNLTDFALNQPSHMKVLKWSCLDECKYECMWTTVDAYEKDRSGVPQFYGKWPFIRFAGIQEPAAMVFSVMNGLTHLAIFTYRAQVPSSAPLYYVWHFMAAIGVMTWSCAAIFHTRDTVTTEKMDYFSAFGLVCFNLFSLVCRASGTHRRLLSWLTGSVLLIIYSNHIYYLNFVKFDYGYNMLVNIAVGAVNGAGWITWCLFHRRDKPHWWKGCSVILGLNLLLLMELGDFPPILWTLDAHALWHLGTVPLNLLWYSFIIDDSLQELKLTDTPGFKKML